jgi:polyisoprenoid-binding protein YceI
MNRSAFPALAAVLLLATTMAANAQSSVNTDPAAAPSGRYNVIAGHTQVMFSIIHMGISPYFGSFGKASGSLQFDSKALEKSSVTVDIDMASASTVSEEIRNQLLSSNAFDTAKFPKASFRSTSVHKISENTGDITGNLTLHGVTKPVTLHTRFHGVTQNMSNGAARLGFSATAELKRSDFGLTFMPWAPMVADEVDLMIEAEFVQDKQ